MTRANASSAPRRSGCTRSGSARLAHQEEKKGLLEPGYHADFAAYDVDPFERSEIDGLRPVLTVSLGREVFARSA